MKKGYTPTPWYITNDAPPNAPANDAEGATIIATFGPFTVYSKNSTKAHHRQDAELFLTAPGLVKAIRFLLMSLTELHADVVSLVECIEECEEDGGQSYDTTRTRELLGNAHAAMDAPPEAPPQLDMKESVPTTANLWVAF